MGCMPHFVAFAFLLVITSTAILIGNNSYFGTTNLVASDLMEADNSWKVATSILT
jgi:hypothetical protein